jgi:citrate lyase subunit beta/citryl-CoA lyase
MIPEKSYLFVPADRPERFEKAGSSGAHGVIFDLEDSVGANRKQAARDALAKYYGDKNPGAGGPNEYVRINAPGSDWFADDIACCRQLNVRRIVLPKAEDLSAIETVAQSLDQVDIVLILESALGFDRIGTLAASRSVVRLMLGAVDLSLDCGITDDDAPLHYYRSLLVQHSRIAGLAAPVDGVCLDLKDAERLDFEVRRAKSFGFGAKASVHPSQVAGINKGLSPSEKDIEWAKSVLSVTDNGAAVALDGKLVDIPILLRAQSILAAAAAP